MIDRMLSKGIATFIVDTHTPRGENDNCGKFLTVLADVQNKNQAVLQLITQGGDDAVAALKVVKAMPDIDPNKVFLMGISAVRRHRCMQPTRSHRANPLYHQLPPGF